MRYKIALVIKLFFAGIATLGGFGLVGLMVYSLIYGENRPIKLITTEGVQYYDDIEKINERCAVVTWKQFRDRPEYDTKKIVCDYILSKD